jgi:hypothetical protein
MAKTSARAEHCRIDTGPSTSHSTCLVSTVLRRSMVIRIQESSLPLLDIALATERSYTGSSAFTPRKVPSPQLSNRSWSPPRMEISEQAPMLGVRQATFSV